jgi:hypothetical protein
MVDESLDSDSSYLQDLAPLGYDGATNPYNSTNREWWNSGSGSSSQTRTAFAAIGQPSTAYDTTDSNNMPSTKEWTAASDEAEPTAFATLSQFNMRDSSSESSVPSNIEEQMANSASLYSSEEPAPTPQYHAPANQDFSPSDPAAQLASCTPAVATISHHNTVEMPPPPPTPLHDGVLGGAAEDEHIDFDVGSPILVVRAEFLKRQEARENLSRRLRSSHPTESSALPEHSTIISKDDAVRHTRSGSTGRIAMHRATNENVRSDHSDPDYEHPNPLPLTHFTPRELIEIQRSAIRELHYNQVQFSLHATHLDGVITATLSGMAEAQAMSHQRHTIAIRDILSEIAAHRAHTSQLMAELQGLGRKVDSLTERLQYSQTTTV